MKVELRAFLESDISYKVAWINNPKNNQYLHYDLPLEYQKTLAWFRKSQEDQTRLDLVIECDSTPVGLIGLLNIDQKNRAAEYYVAIGEPDHQGRGVASRATALLLAKAFGALRLHRVYLYTETENLRAQRLFDRMGFCRDGCLRDELRRGERYVSRYIYSILKDEYENSLRNDSGHTYPADR